MGVIDGDFLSRVMSELAPITLGRDEFTSGLPDVMLACHFLLLVFFGGGGGFMPGRLEDFSFAGVCY